MVLTVGKDVGEHFQGAGCISKYSNISKNSHKIAEKSGKIEGWCSLLVMTLDNMFRVQSRHSKYGNLSKNSHKRVMMLGNILRVQARLSNMVIYPNMIRK